MSERMTNAVGPWSGLSRFLHGRASVHLCSEHRSLLPGRNVNLHLSESSAYSPSVERFRLERLNKHIDRRILADLTHIKTN